MTAMSTERLSSGELGAMANTYYRRDSTRLPAIRNFQLPVHEIRLILIVCASNMQGEIEWE